MQPPLEDGPGAVESNGDPAAFDPGIETGYLRRAPRTESPPVELGARPFDPGPEIGFDERRAKRLRRRREREEVARREAEEGARLEAERTRREAEEQRRLEGERATREAEERARLEAERARREAEVEAERERREAEEARRREFEQRERREAEERRRREKEHRRREVKERARQEAEGKRRAAAERVAQGREEARKRALREQRKEERRERRDDRRAALRRLGSRIRSRGSDAGTRLARAGERAGQLPGRLRSIRRAKHPAPRKRARSVRRIEPGLARPTAKASAAIAAVAVAAGLAGSVLGLPLPFESSTRSAALSLNASGVAALPVDSGIAAALYRGPFHPVLGKYDYGESGAEFGASRGGRGHEGQDIFSKSGTPLVAVRDGIVVDRADADGAYAGGRGHYVAIYSPIEDRSYVYLHLLRPASVAKGDRVHAGQIIGLMGCTGSCYGTHLHFEVRKGRATFRSDTKAIDPISFLRDLPQAPERLTTP